MVVEAIGYFSIVLLTETPYYRGVVGWIERKRARLLLNQMKANNAVTSVSVSTDEEAVVTNFKDEDILYEEECVRNANKDEFALCIQNLVKIYPSGFIGGKAKHAVRGLTLGCQEGERLGFLGVNGAGKSTTLGVLTGDIAPTGIPSKDKYSFKTYSLYYYYCYYSYHYYSYYYFYFKYYFLTLLALSISCSPFVVYHLQHLFYLSS